MVGSKFASAGFEPAPLPGAVLYQLSYEAEDLTISEYQSRVCIVMNPIGATQHPTGYRRPHHSDG